ncbi:MAG: hypothetical protein EA357_03065 [Micavibrio sp.]|nr:MAG: hypothetical protein EA357_03065 [Micavibrio sp.]
MKKIFPVFAAALFFLVLSPFQARAQDINDAGAAALKKLVEDQIAYADQVYQNVQGFGIKHSGDVEVTQHSGYYQVRLPHAVIETLHPENTQEIIKIDLGRVVMNVVPKDDDVLSMSIALPMPLTGKDSQGETVFTLNVGEQRAHALYMPSMLAAPRYHLSYKNVTVTDTPEGVLDLEIGELFTDMKLEKGADGYWSGPNNFSAKDVRFNINAPEGHTAITVGEIVSRNKYKSYDLAGATKFYREISLMDPESMSATENEALIGSIFTQMLEAADGIDSDFSVKNLSFLYHPAGKPEMRAAVANAGLGFGMDGMRSELSSIRFSINLNGLETTAPEELRSLIPTDAEYKMRIVNLPLKGLMGLLGNVMQPESRHMQPEIQSVMQMFSNAGTKFILDNKSVQTPSVGGQVNGEAQADSTAVWGVTAAFTGVLRNLDELIAEMSGQLPAMPVQVQQAFMPLGMMQQFGTPGTDPATGQSTRTYEFSVTREGQILLNGQDMMSLIGMGMGMPGTPTPY